MNFASLGKLPDNIRAWPSPIKALTAFVSGILVVAAQPPWGLWPLLFAGFSVFYMLLSTLERPRAAFVYGWLFGFGYFTCGLSWIANALLVEGNDFAWVWPFAVAGLPTLLALFPAFASAVAVRYAPLRNLAGFLLFVALMMGSEWLRGHIFTGFPWNLYGYIWSVSLPMAQLVSLGGIYVLSLLTLFWGALPGFLVAWQAKPQAKGTLTLIALASIAASYGYGHYRLAAHPTVLKEDVVIRLVQPNIAQEDKWNPGKASENFDKLIELSRPDEINQSLKTIIVWPETALSQAYVMRNGPRAQTAMERLITSYKNPVFLLSGMMRFERDEADQTQYFNSLAAFNGHLEMISVYNKSHLVPFGEYIPLQKWLPITPFVQFSGFTAGNGPETIPLPGIGNYSPLVCYEIIFPGAVTAKSPRPDFIINITNDAWYGESAGPYQHFVKTKFRAIEEGIPVIRAANTGISGVIDPLGRTIIKRNLFETAGVNVNMPQPLAAPTLYAKWRDKMFFFCLLCLSALFVYQSWHGLFSKLD